MPRRHHPLPCLVVLVVHALALTWCAQAPSQEPPRASAATDAQAPPAVDWQARDARQRQRELEQLAGLDAAARSRMAATDAAMSEALAEFEKGKPAEALRQFRAALAAAEAILPGPSSRRVEQLLQLAELQEANDGFASASQTLEQADEQSTALFSAEHPLSLAIINRLGTFFYAAGQYAKAEARLSQAVEISRRLYGPTAQEHLTCVNNLASLWHAQGRYAKALPLLLNVAQQIEQHYGPEHPQYATALNNLAGLDQSLGDFPRATERLRQALAIRQSALGADDEDTLTSLNNLAGIYLQTGKTSEALHLFAQVVEARRVRGTEHPDYATSLSNLAAAHEAAHNLAEAERLALEALRIRERILGPRHPDVATSLNNLAVLLDARQRHDEAEALLRRALAIREEQLGKLHVDYAASLNNLAVHFRQSGRPQEAAEAYRRALDAQQQIIEITLPALLERQQLSLLGNLRRTLDGYLSIAALAKVEPADVYRHVLWWKGQVLVRQLARRQATGASSAAPLLDHLRAVSGQLAAAALAPAGGEEAALREARIQKLTQERERLESEIAQVAPTPPENRAASSRDLAGSLPAGAVLIDFLEYWRTAREGIEPRLELTAFVIQGDKQVTRLDFGPVDSLADTMETWLRTWGAPGKGEDAGARLRERLWLPLQPYITQGGLVLCSPDGCLTRLPLSALPGKQAGTYLIEEQTIVVLPVPQLLPSLLANAAPAGPRQASLLLVGDIDYGVPKPAQPNQAGGQLSFDKLDAARGEILAVRDSFERAFPAAPSPLVLRGTAATEEAVRRKCPEHQFIHVVTHGFVAGPSPAAQPLLVERLCGIALAGANSRREETADDGILTAAEAAELDLRGVRLVVLSACETGSGTIAAGEGVLGLQRVFQMAGAQTVIASLWKVDDRATQQMMDLFYEKLWSSTNRLSRIEALRQAQLAILRGGQDRGAGIVSRTAEVKRALPYYWAPFVLSGDWR